MKIKNLILVFLSCFFLFLFSLFVFIRDDHVKGILRQKEEEKLADEFLELIYDYPAEASLQTVGKEETEEKEPEDFKKPEERKQVYFPDLNYDDIHYANLAGTVYTPDYAKGHLFCVLEIPSIKLRRGVYTGTDEEINYDLDIWMVTAARPDYILGDTHLCIYGHNSTTQELSFNYLKNLKAGDIFILTAENAVYVYRVERMFADWRECITRDYVDNFHLPPDKCYIITCGRDEYRYKDLVAEGILIKTYTLKEWKEILNPKMTGIEEIKKKITENTVKKDSIKETGKDNSSAILSAEIKKDMVLIKLSCERKDYNQMDIKQRKICITDDQGLFLRDKNGDPLILITDDRGEVSCPVSYFTPELLYVLGLYDINPDKEYVRDMTFTLHDNPASRVFSLSTEDVKQENISFIEEYRVTAMSVFLYFTGCLVILSAFFLFKDLIGRNKTKKNE